VFNFLTAVLFGVTKNDRDHYFAARKFSICSIQFEN